MLWERLQGSLVFLNAYLISHFCDLIIAASLLHPNSVQNENMNFFLIGRKLLRKFSLTPNYKHTCECAWPCLRKCSQIYKEKVFFQLFKIFTLFHSADSLKRTHIRHIYIYIYMYVVVSIFVTKEN